MRAPALPPISETAERRSMEYVGKAFIASLVDERISSLAMLYQRQLYRCAVCAQRLTTKMDSDSRGFRSMRALFPRKKPHTASKSLLNLIISIITMNGIRMKEVP